MGSNEERMKLRGEQRVWNTVRSKHGNLKKVSSTQIGQQIIFDDALRILPLIREWIERGSASIYRKELKDYFIDDEILLQKITESLLLLASSAYAGERHPKNSKRTSTRHKRIALIRDRLMPDLSFDQTWRFIEVMIEASDYFDVKKSLSYRDSKASWSMSYECNLSEIILNKLALEAHSAFFPEPMTTLPRDWIFENEALTGGYEYYQFELIRASAFTVDYTKYSKRVFDSVNYIQKTPWRVNSQLVDQVKADLKIPKREDYIKTIYPEDEGAEWELDLKDESLDLSKKAIEIIKKARAEFGEKAELYHAEAGDFESALGKYRAVKLALGIAEQYINEENIYFPHSYDFRGRIYPLPVGLSPQGSDAVKSMLEYSKGEKLNQVGEDWCWAYLTTLTGDDKIPFEERIEKGKTLLHSDYKEADEPYQFLAHQLEMRKYVEDNNYEVKIRIHLDACNSGSQFTSAITGDAAGCKATNVIPTINEDGSHIRLDAYLLVADKSLELTKELIKESKLTITDLMADKVAKDSIKAIGRELELTKRRSDISILRFFRKLLEKDGRKICKTPVMVSNYGGTAGGRAEIIWDLFRELGVDRKWITKKNASNLSRIIGDSIEGVLNGGKAFEIYIHKMNNVIARKNKPVTWDTSDGFHVIHMKQRELKRKQVSCMLPGAGKPTTINKKIYSDKLSPAKMKSAISPNFIHSLDAELLRRVALRMKSEGIIDSDFIHDSFGCRPNYVDKMLIITKEEFKSMARRQPLKILDKQLRAQADNSKATQKVLDEIKIPQLKGFDASNGGLDVVMNSNWFFS